MASPHFTTKRIWHLAAFLFAAVGALAVFRLEIFVDSGGRATAYDVAGPSIFAVIAIPLILTALPVVPLRRAWVGIGYICAVAMIIFTVTGILSVGLLFLPAAITAIIAAFVRPEAQS